MGKKIQCIGRYVMDGVTLGKGNFAKVELATHGVTGCKVAIKIMETRKIKEDYTRNNLHREARILGQVRHPNIIRLYETLKATTLYCLVLEYASGGDLLAFIKSQKEGRLGEDRARCFFRQLISAIHFLHERGVAHRDLKMENILLDEKCKNIKVIDFGLSNTYDHGELMKTHCGSLEYAAPELIATNDRYGPEVDIWSMGVILYCMVIGKLPFMTHYTDQYRRQKLQQQIEKGLVQSHLRDMSILSSELCELLKKVLEPCLELRLPISDMQTHPWVTQHNKVPFHTFQHLPKDKSIKSIDLDNETDTEEVIEELATLLETPKEKIENVVHESKCDDLSAMFNMLLDCKRQDKGLFDIDFTLKQEEKTKHHRRRHHRHKHDDEKPKAKQSTIVCPDIKTEASSDHEGETNPHTSHNTTNFDLMALCSAPTWLGPERRKTRRRRSPLPPPSPLVAEGMAAIGEAEAPSDSSNLLHPGPQASTQVAAFLRRSSSRRRSRRQTTSADPPSRHSSFHSRRSIRRSRPSTPSSQPHSPNSPSNLNNPEIKIEEPKQSPIPIVKRPANLLLRERHTISLGHSTKSNLEPETVYRPTRSNRRRRVGRDHTNDHTDSAECYHSDSSNPCSRTNLVEHVSDESTEMLSNPNSRPGSRNSLVNEGEETVESKIAATDIRSIVRPKQFVLHGVVNGPSSSAFSGERNSLIVPNGGNVHNRGLSVSPDVIIEPMQPTTYANSSEVNVVTVEEAGADRSESSKMNNAKTQDLVLSDIRLPTLISSSDYVDSSTECLGAAGIKPVSADQCNTSKFHSDNETCTEQEFYANFDDSANVFNNDMHNSVKESDIYSASNNPVFLEQDLYSKQDKISLNAQNIICDDECFVESSDHNSSQENLLSKHTRTKLDSFTSDEIESHSAPVLISARDYHSPTDVDNFQVLPKMGSVRSSRHGSTPSFKFTMPSTPIRQMFKTPIARIESFHSDDFEAFSSDVDALVTPTDPSPMSAQTPTVPCFQYRLNKHKKSSLPKHAKNRRALMKDGACAKDGIMTMLPENTKRSEHSQLDQFFSSGSEGGSDGQMPDGEKALSKSKIYPMGRDDDPSDQKLNKLSDRKMTDHPTLLNEVSNTQSNSKTYQNSVNKASTTKSECKKSGMKTVWKIGFAHLLKKKKLNQLSSSGNNNNVDSPSRNHQSSNNRSARNGHARGTIPVSPAGSHEVQETSLDAQWSSTALLPNNVPDAANIKPSPPHSPSPTRSKVYDFTTVMTTEQHKQNPCFLSWRSCRECTFSDDHSSPESSEGNICMSEGPDQSDINVTSIPMTTFQDTTAFPCSTAHS